ncbi:MAG: spore gernimation protein [Clostridia bacterium]|nr:spore gernimation protein [Clostridia bacterium]
MTNSITNRQLFFILFITLTTYNTIDLPHSMAQAAGRSSWIPIICTSIIFSVAALIITKLNNMFLGKVFFDYSKEIVGKFFTYIIAVYFILFYLTIGIYLKLKMVGLLTSNFLPKTPEFVFLLFVIALFAYVSYKGITNIARIFEIYGVSFLIITLLICVLMVAGGTKYNVLPFFNVSEVKEYAKTIKGLFISFGGIEILFIIPFSAKNKKAPKTAFFTMLFIGLFYVLIVESTIMILGLNNTILLNDSFIEALKITEAPVIERLDIFYLTFGLASLFSGMIIVNAAVVEFACKIFSKIKRHIIIIVISVVYFILCMLALNMKNIGKIYESFIFYLILISDFFIPIIVFIIAKIRKHKKHN